MKKIGVIIIGIFLIVLSFQVSAIVGVSPGIYEVDFEPGLKQQFIFNFRFDEGVESEIYTEGDLSEYVVVDKESLVGGGPVVSKMELPSNIEVPGPHQIFIGARQFSASKGSIGIVGNVRGIILVKVPYPGQYVEIDGFKVTNANQGEPINITLKVDNKGKENLNVYAIVGVYDDKNKLIDSIHLGNSFIETTGSYTFNKIVSTSDYKSGDYRAKAVVTYGEKTLESEDSFRLGILELAVSGHTKEFVRDKINQFDIEVESFWNNELEEVYLDVQIVDYDMNFLTPSADVEGWSKVTFSGFFDTTEIEERKFKANVTINYAGKKTSEIINLKFKSEINYTLYALIGGGIFLVILFISIVIAMIVLFMRVAKNGKK